VCVTEAVGVLKGWFLRRWHCKVFCQPLWKEAGGQDETTGIRTFSPKSSGASKAACCTSSPKAFSSHTAKPYPICCAHRAFISSLQHLLKYFAFKIFCFLKISLNLFLKRVALRAPIPAHLLRSNFPAYPAWRIQRQSSHHFNCTLKLKGGSNGIRRSPETAAVLGTEEKHLRVQCLKSTSNARRLRDALSISEHGFEGLWIKMSSLPLDDYGNQCTLFFGSSLDVSHH